MVNILFKNVSEDIISFIKEYERDFLGYYLDDLKEFAEDKNYEGMFDEIMSIISNGVYHHNYEIYNLYGSLYIYGYVYSYNKKFYKYLYSALKNTKHKACVEYAKYIKILLNSDYNRQSIEDIINVLTNKNENILIVYRDNSDNITERVISNVKLYLDNYLFRSIITADCHLRKAERNFKLGSIISARLVE